MGVPMFGDRMRTLGSGMSRHILSWFMHNIDAIYQFVFSTRRTFTRVFNNAIQSFTHTIEV